MKLTIYNDTDSFDVYDNDILQLELKLNRTKHGIDWGHIGDHIYYYYVREDCIDQPPSKLEVTKEQYTFLLDLHKNVT